MEYLIAGIRQGFCLLFPPEKELLETIFLSFFISGCATISSLFLSIPAAIFLSLFNFKGKRVVLSFLNTSLFVPPVFIGLLVYILFSRKGPFGALSLLFTPYVMIIAQCILATPIIITFISSGMKDTAVQIKDLALSLGANKLQAFFLLLKEEKFVFLSAATVGFSRVVGETGMALVVGGNIRGETRTITTAVVLETAKGNFDIAIALGFVLILIAVCISVFLQTLQGKQ